jgi:hypothetical protein
MRLASPHAVQSINSRHWPARQDPDVTQSQLEALVHEALTELSEGEIEVVGRGADLSAAASPASPSRAITDRHHHCGGHHGRRAERKNARHRAGRDWERKA